MIEGYEWNEFAKIFGFRDEKHMLSYFYEREHLTVGIIAEKLGVGPTTVARRLNALGIVTRRRGGANHNPRQKLKLHYMDQRIVFGMSHKELSEYSRVNVTTIWSYKKGVERTHAICSDITNWRPGTVQPKEQDPSGASPGGEQDLQGILPFPK